MGKRATKYVGVLTSGGDSPGLNAALRAIGKAAMGRYEMQVIGFRDGFKGLMENRFVDLGGDALSGILTLGGTILGTSREKPHAMMVGGAVLDMTQAIVENYRRHHLDVLVCLGGGGTQKNAYRLAQQGPERDHAAQDDRQRRGADRRQLRLRHGARHRHRGDRPPAQHRPQPSPDHRGRADGPPHGLADARARGSPAAPT